MCAPTNERPGRRQTSADVLIHTLNQTDLGLTALVEILMHDTSLMSIAEPATPADALTVEERAALNIAEPTSPADTLTLEEP